MGEPGLVLSRDHVERQPRPGPKGLDDLDLVARDAQSRRPDHGDAADIETAGLVGHLADRLRGPIERHCSDLAGGLEALAEPGHDGPVDDGPPAAVEVELREVELGRVRSRVDDGIALRHPIDEHPEPGPDVLVDVGAEPERIDRGHDGRRVRRLDRDRRRPAPVMLENGALGLAPGNGIAGALLADPQQAWTTGTTDPCGRQDRLQAQTFGRHVRKWKAESMEHRPRSLLVERERRLEDRLPALEAVGVCLAEDLDVHQLVPDLDVVAVRRQQVELLALLDRRLRRLEHRICRRDAPGEGAPLPARDDPPMPAHELHALLPGAPAGRASHLG